MRPRSNSSTMIPSHKSKVPGYHRHVWFSENTITNIVSLNNIGYQYLVTYSSDEKTFIVHRETEGKENMPFRMNENRMHYFDPRDDAFTFVNNLSKNMKNFTKIQIKDGEVARQLYKTLVYPPTNDFRWAVQSHQIKNCPVTVQNVDDVIKIG